MLPSAVNKSPKNGNKKPRIDKYERLLHRFFEALILLHVLGQTRGKHDKYPGDAFTPQEKRRRLLCNLAYLCDYDKGGPTTSAIGIEDGSNQFIFWVASNANGTSREILKFLRAILVEAKRIIRLDGGRRPALEDNFTRMCIEFAKRRVKKEAKKLWKAIDDAGEKCLDLQPNSNDIRLWKWLQKFREQDPVDLCYLAYEQRRADEMKHVVTKIDTAQCGQGVRTASDVFYYIRHYVGRLAHHVRAPKQVLEDFACLEHLLDTYDIRLIAQVANIEPPEPDGHTTLEGILKHKTYLNWGPPLLPGGAEDPGYVQQRKLLNDMLVTIRREALDQLRNKAGPLKWHPDSHTGITRSLASEPVNFGALRSVEDRLAALNLDPTDPSNRDNEGNRPVSPVYSSASSGKAAGYSSQQRSDSSDNDDSASGGGVSLS
ncbi:hypothetical protein DL768_002176 [Monosporascus sp. mg162]|nr:hypothetical protein DL768_002176 [Monosporascus sp. mg162]